MAQDFDNRNKPARAADLSGDASLGSLGDLERVEARIRVAVGQETGTVIVHDYQALPLDLRREFDDALSSSQAIGYTEKK